MRTTGIPIYGFGNVAQDERQQVRRHLEEYCGLDTEGMVLNVDGLRRLMS